MLTLLALSPFVLLIVLIFFARRTILQAGMISLIWTIYLVFFVWKIPLGMYFGVLEKASLSALDISLVVIGAVIFLEVAKITRILTTLEHFLNTISSDIRIQTIILVWFLASFLEGTAGFGSPLLMVVPLLIQIGFTAPSAIVIALIGDSVAVAYGAVGTPIKIGLSDFSLNSISHTTALFAFFVGIFMPIIILWVTRSRIPKRTKYYFRDIIPFALWSGFAMMIPFSLVSLIGNEFPAIIGPVVGLILTILVLKMGWFLPKRALIIATPKEMTEKPHLGHIIAPYATLAVLLLLSRFIMPSFLVTLKEGITHRINLFNPGFSLLVTAFIFLGLHKISLQTSTTILKSALYRALKISLTIFIMVALSQFILHTDINSSGYHSMLTYLVNFIKPAPIFVTSPLLAALGAFLAGSSTVSNLLFGHIQAALATTNGIAISTILAIQALGATGGNMLSLINISSVQALVGEKNKEKEILLAVLPFCLLYIIFIAVVAFICSHL